MDFCAYSIHSTRSVSGPIFFRITRTDDSSLWAVMMIAITRLKINIIKAADYSEPTSLSNPHLLGLRRRQTTVESQLPSQTMSKRSSSHTQRRSITELRHPIESSISTVTAPDGD